ncbi:MAG: 1-deoxy-D-xylulose-5-phosphate synthase [Clostridia bacterium]|nr:1-deoxy-D-xylulose-5-phosphate synthase [Clostridia bacterium]
MKFLSLEELRALSPERTQSYCKLLRRYLVENVTRNGGHLASNLGVVEISVALARVMDLPREEVVYDTGHQCYVHKLLTGRGDRFSTLRRLDGLSGFPRREESEFDAFGTGHSGTGISAALGFSKAKRLKGEDGFTVAVIGDGAFTGGMVFEALNNVSPEDRIIIILNDNGMSIAKSVGRIKSALNSMRTAGYYRFKSGVQSTLSGIPLVGEGLAQTAKAIKDGIKRNTLPLGNLFEQFGLHYFGPADGNDVGTVETLLREAKKKARPSIIHLCTRKGKGYQPAEEDPSRFHGLSPASGGFGGEKKSFSQLFGEAALRIAAEDSRMVCITAAMEDGVGLSEFSRRYPRRFFDVGIAEEHAMTFAAALRAGGAKPVFAVYSTFYQRAVDQFLHDAALQKLPVVLCLDRAGIGGEDGATHQGVFDLPLTLCIPNVKIYAPCSGSEIERFLRKGLAEEEMPSVIRYEKGTESEKIKKYFSFSEEIEKKDFGNGQKCDILMVTFGRMTHSVLSVCEKLEKEGLSPSVIRFAALKGFDPKGLPLLFGGNSPILFVEEGVKIGGFSAYLSALLAEAGLTDGRRTRILALEEGFIPHGKTSELWERYGLGEDQIEKEVRRLVQN